MKSIVLSQLNPFGISKENTKAFFFNRSNELSSEVTAMIVVLVGYTLVSINEDFVE